MASAESGISPGHRPAVSSQRPTSLAALPGTFLAPRLLEQAEGRLSSYQGSRKVFLCSSPTIAGLCTISDEYAVSDQREYFMPCPHCSAMHTWDFDNLTADGQMLCAACGKFYDEKFKTSMMDPANGARWIAKLPERAVPGFHANALYTPYRLGDSWVALAEMRDRADREPERQVAFTQMKKALPFAGERERADEQILRERAELGLHVGRVPNGYYILTAGVDCQADRFAVQVIAWGKGERGVVVMYEEIPGDPSSQEGYADLDRYLQNTYAKGAFRLVCECVAVDGGNWTEEVAKFVRTRERRLISTGRGYAEQRVVLVRGRSAESGRVVNRPRKSEANAKGKTIARGVGVWGVGTDVAKNVLFGRIAADAKCERVDERYLRFPGGKIVVTGGTETRPGALPLDYYHQLTAEYYDKTARKWIHEKKIRNEAIDSLVYAYFAALHPHVRLDLIKEHEWEAKRLAQEGSAHADLFSSASDEGRDDDPPVELPQAVSVVVASRETLQSVSATPPVATPDPFASQSWSDRL